MILFLIGFGIYSVGCVYLIDKFVAKHPNLFEEK